jgi:hypothetical protein
MISLVKIGGQYNSSVLELYGLSTDEKPIHAVNGRSILNGSTFLEMDTAKVFIYSESNETWYEIA